MLKTTQAYRGAVVAPHHLASQAGLRVLQEGGNAVEAMIASAATIAVVYPHMNGLGGDNFWLISNKHKAVTAIDACGGAAAAADPAFYRSQGYDAIPSRGPLAALTVGGAVSGWASAHQYSQQQLNGKLPLSRLLEDATYHAANGVAVTDTLANNVVGKRDQLDMQPGFAERYLPGGQPIKTGDRLLQSKVAATLEQLAKHGLDDFYRGELARAIADDLGKAGSPLTRDDLARHQALNVDPLELNIDGHRVFNLPPPTQGLASLLLLGMYDRARKRLGITEADTVDYIHTLVEATKGAFRIRDSVVTDPDYMAKPATEYLTDAVIHTAADRINLSQADPWPDATGAGDTVWLGAVDRDGNAVSFIQSVFWEFGSGVVLDQSGITWQNRGTSFSLDEQHHNCLKPYRRPFHTIQPALAHLSDGRVMPYGTMGGEGQPQTQAMLFSRYVMHAQSLQQSVTGPRWLLGKTWGSDVTNLRIENRFPTAVFDELVRRGHDLEPIGDFDEVMGHAGALVLHTDGRIEAAADPRSDGAAVGY